ncbi:hypothetical protein HN709_02660 [Candidatus Peregrinibacteria bacterium]|jgi:cell fate regulator YaaT (PSP1 superfamily)|nr:hypothetical protein [Candidatus Peregrinibacteria bacterium]MBT7736565.1 hypothetical protein [Candidatus Peregrinibacteria bacterium]
MATKVTGIDCAFCSRVYEIPFSEKAAVSPGDSVIFRDDEGREEFGRVKYVNKDAAEEESVITSSKVLRKATANDLQKIESHKSLEDRALATCAKLIEKHELDMNVFKSTFSFDGNKVHFTFTADERVDFRELVKDLAKSVKKQIHLRQIGPRDKARLIGGYGKCGRQLCCEGFLDKLESINMEMVRAQGLESKGSSKLSGACGKLLCCLKYEVEAYKALRKNLPNIGNVVKVAKACPVASGKEVNVVGLDVLNQKVKAYAGPDDFVVFDVKHVEKLVKKSNR